MAGEASFRASMQNSASMVIDTPGENPAAKPIDHGGEIDGAARHRDVRNIHGPDLIWPDGRHVAQEIGVDLVSRRRLSRCWAYDKSPRSPCASSALRHAGAR